MVLLCRSTPLPAKATLEPVAILQKPDAKSWTVVGFASSATWVYVHDGHKDMFETMPSHVRKSFKSTTQIRKAMGLDEGSSPKVVAIVLQSYKTKGPNSFEVNDRKMRSGYGQATIVKVPRDTSAKNVKAFFDTVSTDSTDIKGGNKTPELPQTMSAADGHDVPVTADTENATTHAHGMVDDTDKMDESTETDASVVPRHD